LPAKPTMKVWLSLILQRYFPFLLLFDQHPRNS
jgi:hypothetical protein